MRFKLVVLLIAVSVKIHGQTDDVLGSFTSHKSLIDSIENALPGYKYYNMDSDAHTPTEKVIQFKKENSKTVWIQYVENNQKVFNMYLYGDYSQMIALWKRWVDDKADEKKIADLGTARFFNKYRNCTIHTQGEGWMIIVHY